jgi:tetratricopeptide (TPR) repeat protein
LAALILAGCGSTPKPADPPRLRAALEAENDGARRFGRGDYIVAARRFDEAARLFAGIDDEAGTLRNRQHLARSELALGRYQDALRSLASTASADQGQALETLQLRAQAQLALNDHGAAGQSLAAAIVQCGAVCPQAASLHLLQARTALASNQMADALMHAQAALKLLQDKNEAAETGNAWRIIAAARLAGGDAAGALPAAQTALDIDRQLALPEKIASDWMLIGAVRLKAGAGDAAAAYRRALEVARAAGLGDITVAATRALQEIPGAGASAR